VENLYKQYFDVMPCYLTVQDKNLRILDTNDRFKADFGDCIGQYCYKAYKHRDEKCPNCTVLKTFQDGQSYGNEEIVQTRDGQYVSVIIYTRPIRDKNGDIVAVMEMSTDITEVKMLQNKLHASEELYRLLFDEVPCYITSQDRDLKIVRSNRRFKEDFGKQPGGHCYEIYKHRKEPCLICPVEKTFQDGRSHTSEEVVTSQSGEEINVLVNTAPIRDHTGKIIEVMEMSTNITEIRRIQSQLTSLGLLVSSISHGIKGQLTGLDGGVYLMNSGYEKNNPERVKKGWDMVKRNVDRVRSMVLDILYYAKDRAPELDTVSVLDLVKDLSETMDNKAENLGIKFIVECAPDVDTFEADPKAIRSMLTNILENSIDACRTDQEKDDHSVRFLVASDPDNIIFKIVDNGVGIDRETKEKVFSLFFSSKGIEGTGLGLFISNKIVTGHGGTIDVDSTPKVGTTFTIRIPKVQAPGDTLPGKENDRSLYNREPA